MGIGQTLVTPSTQSWEVIHITPERWQQVKGLLCEALEYEPEQQQAFLASVCKDDSDLRNELELLLAHQVDTNVDMIEKCAADAAQLRIEVNADSERNLGMRIGAYRILREIGHGGMGSVYLAKRDDEVYRQEVAIKLIKPGLGGEAIRRRFSNETQILADLNHPNIARLLDAGETAEGLPYLVMEYVEGSPINSYCDEHNLSTTERLKLFSTVCSAMQYAHQRLVIHRDIKPGNILVTRDGAPKLVDFGIAKLVDADRPAAATEATATAMLFMTPEYASPEQIRGLSVATPTDVYSLGVVLYELLSGRLPYRFKSRLPHDVAQAICDQEPERPSTAIGRGGPLSPTEAQSDVHGHRENLRNRLHGDLDNIVLMAMRKEPERRYASVAQFAEDIQRHLDGLPVRARTDTFTYRTGKFIRRQKVLVAAAALVVITLLFGIIATERKARLARAERARAERRFNEVRQLANSFVFEVHDAITNLPGSTEARQLIVKRGLTYLDSLAQDAGGDRGLQRELAGAYEKLGVVQYTPSIAHLGDLQGALQSHRKAAALREALVAAEPGNLDYQRELLDSYWFIATLVGAQGDLPKELEMLRQQLPARENLAAVESHDFVDRYNLAGTYAYIGGLLMETGDVQRGLENQQKALRLREALHGVDPDKTRSTRALTISYEYLGRATEQAGDRNGALELQRRGLKMRQSLLEADPLNTDLRLMLIESHRFVGDLLLKLREPAKALEHYRKQLALVEEMVTVDPVSAQFRSNKAVALMKLGDVDSQTGRMDQAISNYTKALRIREQLHSGAETDTLIQRDLAEVWIKLGDALLAKGERANALQNYRKSLETLEALSSTIPAHAGIRAMLAEAYSRVGRVNLAIALDSSLPAPKQVEHLRAARSAYGRGLDITIDMRNRSLVSPVNLISSGPSPEKVAAEIAKCDAALLTQEPH